MERGESGAQGLRQKWGKRVMHAWKDVARVERETDGELGSRVLKRKEFDEERMEMKERH